MRVTLLEPEFVHSDERRTLTQLFTANFKQVNLYECKANVSLGDHYHKKTIEYFYIIDGELEVNGREVKARDSFVFHPEQVHTILTKTVAMFMTFLTEAYDKDNPDLWKTWKS